MSYSEAHYLCPFRTIIILLCATGAAMEYGAVSHAGADAVIIRYAIT